MTVPSANKHGLSRRIPADVRRVIRQRDGFGCVLCGSAIYTYEHVDPPFAEAKAHDPARIALLCAGCHDRVTRGLLSKASVKLAMADPRCQQAGFSFGPFDIGSSFPEIRIGPFVAREVAVVLRAMSDDILKVEPPEQPGGPFRISALLANRSGTEVLRIERNEWAASTSSWDVQVEGPRITIHNAPGDVALILRALPPSGLDVERLDMFHKGARFTIRKQTGLTVRAASGAEFTTSDMQVHGSAVAIDVQSDGSMALGRGGSVQIGYMTTGASGGQRRTGRRQGPGSPVMPPPAVPEKHRRSPCAHSSPKVGRNDPCPCGSGDKFKRCCGG